MRLTVRGIEALGPSETRREIPDSLMMGLYLLVQPRTGNKTWAVRCRQNGRPRKFTIGRYPVYGLAEAREAAARILRSVSEGRDPGRPNADSVDAVIAQFLERHARRKYRPSTLRGCMRTMDRALAAWRGRRLDGITRPTLETCWIASRHRRPATRRSSSSSGSLAGLWRKTCSRPRR